MQLLSDGMTLQDSYNQFFNRTPIAMGEASPADYTYLVEDFIDTAMNYTSTTLATYNSSVSTLVSAFSQLQTLASQKNSLGVRPCPILDKLSSGSIWHFPLLSGAMLNLLPDIFKFGACI